MADSILNTIDIGSISEAVKELKTAPFKCIQLQVVDKLKQQSISLSAVLFGSGAVSFSKIAG